MVPFAVQLQSCLSGAPALQSLRGVPWLHGAGVLYLSRRMEFEELVRVLVVEHARMRAELENVKDSVGRHDFLTAAMALKRLDAVFKQHIADEESQILRLLIETYGTRGAAEEIMVFQQHRPLHQLMEIVEGLASLPPSELESNQTKLRVLFDEHTRREEEGVFPKAVDCYRRQKAPMG